MRRVPALSSELLSRGNDRPERRLGPRDGPASRARPFPALIGREGPFESLPAPRHWLPDDGAVLAPGAVPLTGSPPPYGGR